MSQDRTHSWLVTLIGWPGRVLDRASPTGRIILALLAMIVMGLFGVVLRHQAQLRGLPDVGSSYPSSSLRPASAAMETDATPLYRKTIAQLADDGGHLTPALRELWREATDRPEAWVERAPGVLDAGLVRDLTAFSRDALTAARVADSPDAAWSSLRAVLRTSRHLLQHTGWAGRQAGSALLDEAYEPVVRWADGRLTRAQYRRALADLQALDAMTPPPSTTWRHEFAGLETQLDTPPASWSADAGAGAVPPDDRSTRLNRFLQAEPARSRRVLRLIAANWLAVSDLAPAQRPDPTFSEAIVLFDLDDPSLPRAARSLPAEAIARAYDASEWPTRGFPDFFLSDAHFADRARRAELILEVARRAYRAEHGTLPEYDGQLVGPYLDRLPPGASPLDP